MPEGDTIFRTAETLRRWLGGREITAAQSRVHGFPAARLVGMRAEGCGGAGKHLLIRLDQGQVLHTHLRMTGSWHVYPAGQPWRRPERQARLVVEAGERVAVCFQRSDCRASCRPRPKAPTPPSAAWAPMCWRTSVDSHEIRRRARTRPPELAARRASSSTNRSSPASATSGAARRSSVEHRNPWVERQKLTDEDSTPSSRSPPRSCAAAPLGLGGA